MASVDVKLPDIGEGVNEGEIVRWLVKEGDVVKHDQPLVEVMTDKATVEIPCSAEGKVVKILASEGQVVKVGGSLLQMETGAAASAPAAQGQQPASRAPVHEPVRQAAPASSQKSTWTEGPAQPQAPTTQRPPAESATSGYSMSQSGNGGGTQEIYPPAAGAGVLATPAVRRYAREAGVDLNVLKGTGPAGRITRDDVMKTSHGSHGGHAGATAAARPQYQPELRLPPVLPLAPQAGDERKPFRGIRRKIAENLVRSKQIIPHFTHADEFDVTELVQWRTKVKEEAARRGIKLTYLPFVMKAVVATCREFPQFNASIDDAAGEIVYKHAFNIGFAADTPEGLLVPVVKNVERKNILQVAYEISELADKARHGKLAPDDMKHGSITITNIGSVGGVYATPIINHPEVAIIGIYKIQKKPVVIDGEIKIREMMGVTATCDHRLIDGAAAARFLNKLSKYLENPSSLLLETI